MFEWLYWFLFGLICGIAIIKGVEALAKKGITLRWYEWLLAVITFSLFILAVQTFFGSLAEWETQAAWLGSLFLLIPVVVLAVVIARLVQSRLKKT